MLDDVYVMIGTGYGSSTKWVSVVHNQQRDSMNDINRFNRVQCMLQVIAYNESLHALLYYNRGLLYGITIEMDCSLDVLI